MKGKPQDYMDVGLTHFAAASEPAQAADAVAETWEKLCRDAYFQVVEVTHIADAAARRCAIECARGAGRKVLFTAVPMLLEAQADLGSEDPPTRQRALDVARDGLKEAIEWGALGLAVSSGPMPAEARRALIRSLLIASLKELCEFSRRANELPILLDPVASGPAGFQPHIRTALDAADVADQVYPYYRFCGLCLEAESLALTGEGREGSLLIAREYLRAARIRVPKSGEASHQAATASLLKLLLDAGSLGEGKHIPVVLAAPPANGESFEQAVARAKAFLDAVWAAI